MNRSFFKGSTYFVALGAGEPGRFRQDEQDGDDFEIDAPMLTGSRWLLRA